MLCVHVCVCGLLGLNHYEPKFHTDSAIIVAQCIPLCSPASV